MPNVFLVASAQVDSIVYPAGCVLVIERLRAATLVSLNLTQAQEQALDARISAYLAGSY